ncbi:MAG: tRNA (adenosine(37)-N6)-dimethylallyltransferase MiaA [Patescibacteria group bacterium]
MKSRPKVLIIVGPTSSGKSALAVELARKFDGEIISADSRQVYKKLDIGTGKITASEMKGISHHLLSIVSPKKIFTAHDFVEKGHVLIKEITARGKLPIIAGGTGFYIDALVGRIILPNVPANEKLRTRLLKKTAGQLYSFLEKKDPRRAKTIDPNNKRRLIRALEIIAAIGRVPKNADARHPHFDALWIGIRHPLKKLERKITARLRTRIKQGMIEEGRKLHASGLSYKRMFNLGLEYRALSLYLQGKITRSQMFDELNRDIRNYAKKQMMYWARNDSIRWFDPKMERGIVSCVRAWLQG